MLRDKVIDVYTNSVLNRYTLRNYYISTILQYARFYSYSWVSRITARFQNEKLLTWCRSEIVPYLTVFGFI